MTGVCDSQWSNFLCTLDDGHGGPHKAVVYWNRHEAFVGVTVDHLYKDCPSLASVTRPVVGHVEEDGLWGRRPGERCVGEVDPEGSDICGLCLRRWKAKQ